MPRDNYNPVPSLLKSDYVQQTLRVADSQKTPRHVGTNLRMRSRDVLISAIKRPGGKTTLYSPSSPRLDPHDVTPQNYLSK